MKKIFLLACMALCHQLTEAQSESDALRYSQTTFGGTARTMGMGGSFGALGADMSTMSTNPAGLGVYFKSELAFSPSLYSQDISTQYLGAGGQGQAYNFNFSNLGIVLSYPTESNESEPGWRSVNFGIAYNRLANFNNKISFQGFNNSSSLLDNFLGKLNAGSGTDYNNIPDLYPFDINLAYQTGLIYNNDTAGPNAKYYSSDIKNGGVLQRNTTTSSGAMGETDFSLAANYNDKLYLGATIGVVSVNYSEKSVYEESDVNNKIQYFKSLQYTKNQNTSGSGVNLKLGLIYKITDWFRAGLAYHSPTVLSLSDSYNASMNAYYDQPVAGNYSYAYSSPDGAYNYSIYTPSRVLGSVGFVVAKKMLVNVDLENVNYGNSSISADANFDAANQNIRNYYKNTYNVRMGAEYKLNQVFSLRGGYAYYGSPYKNEPVGVNHAQTNITVGFGIKNKNTYFDMALVNTTYQDAVVPYYLDDAKKVNYVSEKINTNRFVATLGFKF